MKAEAPNTVLASQPVILLQLPPESRCRRRQPGDRDQVDPVADERHRLPDRQQTEVAIAQGSEHVPQPRPVPAPVASESYWQPTPLPSLLTPYGWLRVRCTGPSTYRGPSPDPPAQSRSGPLGKQGLWRLGAAGTRTSTGGLLNRGSQVRVLPGALGAGRVRWVAVEHEQVVGGVE